MRHSVMLKYSMAQNGATYYKFHCTKTTDFLFLAWIHCAGPFVIYTKISSTS